MAKFIRDWTEQKENNFLALVRTNPVVRLIGYLKDKFLEVLRQ